MFLIILDFFLFLVLKLSTRTLSIYYFCGTIPYIAHTALIQTLTHREWLHSNGFFSSSSGSDGCATLYSASGSDEKGAELLTIESKMPIWPVLANKERTGHMAAVFALKTPVATANFPSDIFLLTWKLFSNKINIYGIIRAVWKHSRRFRQIRVAQSLRMT